MLEPPPEMLELDRADLIAIRDAVAKLAVTPFGAPVAAKRKTASGP